MPVEIRELIIRTIVDNSRNSQESKSDSERSVTAADSESIVEECVRQVLKILKKTGGR